MTTKKHRIKFEKKYLKDLKKIPKKERDRIAKNVQALTEDPRPTGCKKLKTSPKEPLFRIRCGDYRVIYSVKNDVLLILVIEVGHRSNIYL